jgi:ATP-dependent DNA helicase RecG
VPGLDIQVMYVRGVGPRLAEMLSAKGILTAEDLLYHLPFRYEDRRIRAALTN